MLYLIFSLFIGCGKKTDTTSTSTQAEQTATVSEDNVQTISLSPNANTTGGVVSASPTNSIEIKAIVRPANSETETEKKEEDILPLPEDADDIDDTVDSE